MVAFILNIILGNLYSWSSGQTGRFIFQMVGSHVFFFFLTDWQKEEIEAGESMKIQQETCFFCGVAGGFLGKSELDLPRARGVLTEREPSGPCL